MSGVGLGLKAISIGAKLSGIGGLIKKIPLWAWIAFALLLLVIAGTILHQQKAHAALKAADTAGYQRRAHEDQSAMDKARAQAVAWKQKADAANTQMAQQEQAAHDQKVSDNRALANALRLRYAQRSQVPASGGSGSGLPGSSAAAVDVGPIDPQADVTVAAGATATVPVGPLIDYAEQCDDAFDWQQRVQDLWKKLKANWPTSAPAPAPH